MKDQSQENNSSGNSKPKKGSSEKSESEEDFSNEIKHYVEFLKEEFEDIPEEKLKTIVQKFLSIEEQYTYEGPLPPQKQFDGYEKVLPGAADRILKMAESNNTTRNSIDYTLSTNQDKRANRGQILGFIIAILIIISVVACSYFGAIVPAAVLGGVGGAAIIAMFVLPERNKQY